MLYPCIFCDALFCKCVQNICTYVVSNVLTYVHYAMSRSNHDCLVKVIETHLLVMIWCVGEEGVVGHLRCGAACQEYQADRLQESHEGLILCIDVIEGMHKLDQCGTPIPTFLCDTNGVGRLPTFSPVDYNVVRHDKQYRKHERLIRSVQQQTTLKLGPN